MESGEEVPAYEQEPELPERLTVYMVAFSSLSITRPVSMAGALPISYTEILAYYYLFPVCDIDVLVRHIRTLDEVFLIYQQENSSG